MFQLSSYFQRATGHGREISLQVAACNVRRWSRGFSDTSDIGMQKQVTLGTFLETHHSLG